MSGIKLFLVVCTLIPMSHGIAPSHPNRFAPIWGMLNGPVPATGANAVNTLHPLFLENHQVESYRIMFEQVEEAETQEELEFAYYRAWIRYELLHTMFVPELVFIILTPVIDAIRGSFSPAA